MRQTEGGRHDPSRDPDWDLVEAQLPTGWRELATEMRLIRKLPEHIGQKIGDVEVVLRLVLHDVEQQGAIFKSFKPVYWGLKLANARPHRVSKRQRSGAEPRSVRALHELRQGSGVLEVLASH